MICKRAEKIFLFSFIFFLLTLAPSPVSGQSSRPGGQYGDIDIDSFVEKLESDRRLLSEIRKEVPTARGEAELYLSRMKRLAAASDPVRLVPLANKLLSQAPTFFDWLEQEFVNQEERLMEYYIGGAQGFHFALEEFKSAVMLMIINRLDVAAGLLEMSAAENEER